MHIFRFLVLGGALLLALPAVAADAASIIKQRARNVANPQPQQPAPQTTPVRPVQPMTPGVRPVTTAPTNAASAPALTPEQEAEIKLLFTDLNAIKAGAKPSADQTAKVQTSLAALADPQAQPPVEAIAKLASELAAAWGTQKMTATEQTRFGKELRRVLNNSSLPAGEGEAAVNGVRSLLKYSGMNEAAAAKIVATLTSIVEQARP